MDKRKVDVDGLTMAYTEVGQGDPIVFLHGNPTSSFLWRSVIAEAAGLGRCVAPDLIGMGDSAKLPDPGPGSYRFVEHRHYLDRFLDKLGIDSEVTLVIHDWGSALGFDWARRHQEAVKGIVYMEAIVRPFASWDEWPERSRQLFQSMRSDAGETIILDKNVFVERILPASIQRDLTAEEFDEYRRPYLDPGEDRRPTLTWPREIPVAGEPPDVHEIVTAYAAWLPASPIPKLFVNAEPGLLISGDTRAFCRTWEAQEEVTVAGLHFIQEDAGAAIGRAIAGWYRRLP